MREDAVAVAQQVSSMAATSARNLIAALNFAIDMIQNRRARVRASIKGGLACSQRVAQNMMQVIGGGTGGSQTPAGCLQTGALLIHRAGSPLQRVEH